MGTQFPDPMSPWLLKSLRSRQIFLDLRFVTLLAPRILSWLLQLRITILKCIYKGGMGGKGESVVWTELIWLRLGTGGGRL